MASHDGISPVGVGGKRTRIPAEDPEEVRDRDNARWSAKHSRRAGRGDYDERGGPDTNPLFENAVRRLEEFDCGN